MSRFKQERADLEFGSVMEDGREIFYVCVEGVEAVEIGAGTTRLGALKMAKRRLEKMLRQVDQTIEVTYP